MPRNVTVTFEDGSQHVYQGAPDDVTPDQIQARASKEFGKSVKALDGGRVSSAAPAPAAQAERSGPQRAFDMLTAGPAAARDLVAGAVRGAGSIGATLLTPIDAAARAMGVQNDYIGRTDRREAMTGALGEMGADTDSLAFGAGKLGGEIAGTAGIGGTLARGAMLLPGAARAAPVIDALATSGMRAGGATGAAGLGARVAGGAVTGGASAGLVNPSDAALGAVIGGALPPVLAGAGKVGQWVGGVYRSAKTGAPVTAKALADAIGVNEQEAQRLMKVAQAQPDELVPGSKLTFSQALQMAGENQPGVKMLERTVSGGPGGDALLKRLDVWQMQNIY